LAEWFDRVIATDASEEQLKQAPSHPKVEFRRALAEASGLADRSADLITVATAIHWFDFDAFHAEVRRVAKPGAVLAAWSYGALVQIEPAIDRIVEDFARETMGPYWPERFHHQWTEYREIPFPHRRLPAPDVAAEGELDLAGFLGWVRSWSSVPRYFEAHGDPIPLLENALAPLWSKQRRVRWPLHFAIGRVG
jgi:ubiquinone/menaquinone biosynthesis C-methylase UbiE